MGYLMPIADKKHKQHCSSGINSVTRRTYCITWKTWKGHVMPGLKERDAGFPFPLAAPGAKYKPLHTLPPDLL